MDENTKYKLDSYLNLLEEIKSRTQDEITARVLLQELSKDLRMEKIKQEREANNGSPVTEKQKSFMKKLKIVIPEGLTKQAASMMIDTELGKNGD